MALHISGKLVALGLVVAALITAFSAPRSAQDPAVPLAISPTATVLSSPTPTDAVQTRLVGPEANPAYVLRATGYNSMVDQTDSTPYITSTGQRTRFGIIAVSPDLLSHALPYGSLVRIQDLGNYYTGRGYGRYQSLLDNQGLFIVEDTMHYRKRDQIDIWFSDYASAVNWGMRKVRVEVIRYGRTGPKLEPTRASSFSGTPRLLASR
ncbi:MAG: hypothetical protein P8Y02_04010 [Deinococcales bacterium]|jgi:3D (Asp-Asp-Asp) domain-containing protein